MTGARGALAAVMLLALGCAPTSYDGLGDLPLASDSAGDVGAPDAAGAVVPTSVAARASPSASAADVGTASTRVPESGVVASTGSTDDAEAAGRGADVAGRSASLLREFDIRRDGSTITAGDLEVDVGDCPSEWRSDGPEVVLFRDDWLGNSWGIVVHVEPESLGSYAYFEQQRRKPADEQLPTLLLETLWSQENARRRDVASEDAIALASLAIERSQAPSGTYKLTLSAADRCLPVIATDVMPFADVSASVWNLPSPLNEHRGMYAHFSEIADDLAAVGMKRVGAFVTRPVCCHGTQDAEADLALVHLEPDPDLQEQFRPHLTEMEEQYGEFLIYSAPEEPQAIEELLAQTPDVIVLDSACEVVATSLREAGFEGAIVYAYPTCNLLDTGLSDDPISLGPVPDCRLCGELRDFTPPSPGGQLRAWLAALQPGDLIVAPFPVPGVDDSPATRAALDYIGDLDRVAWHRGWGAEAQRRLDGWMLGWYADTLLDAAQEIEHRFPHLDLPLRLRVLIAAWHLETPHPLFDTTVRTEVGDPRFTRDLWWYAIDKTALVNGEQFLAPLPHGPQG